MSTVPLYPLRFTPILRRLIWGGRRLGTVLHKPIGDASDYAESWEISDYRDAVSVVENGPLAGSTIRELIQWYGPGLLGPALGRPRPVSAPGQVHRRASGPLGPGSSRRCEGPAAGRRQRQDRDLGHPGSRPGKCDLRRTEARRRPERIRRRDPFGKRRALAPSSGAETGRLHPDRVWDGACHRCRRSAGRDPADLGCDLPRL